MAAAYKEMASVFGGPQGLLQYMMLQNNTYEKLAKANAAAVQCWHGGCRKPDQESVSEPATAAWYNSRTDGDEAAGMVCTDAGTGTG